MLSRSDAQRPANVVVAAGVMLSLLAFVPASIGDSIVGSRHDLSTASTPQVCEFCHTPHHANDNISGLPLWNRAETTQTFTVYGSPSMDTTPGQPGTATSYPGVSTRLCLSCHDGVNASTVVHGNVVSTKHDLVYPPGGGMPDMTSYPNCERCHPNYYSGRRRVLVLGTNLGNDHPVSMPYPNFTDDPDFQPPPSASSGWGGTSKYDVKLFYGSVECTSCHEPHDPRNGDFLRKPNNGSELCLTCHKK